MSMFSTHIKLKYVITLNRFQFQCNSKLWNRNSNVISYLITLDFIPSELVKTSFVIKTDY